ncbi:hypothetical protein LWI29_032793 [Acer saccharum]|uniref:Uncharacterized protein n=1 Tax=Acer saccharum TaxID=4024 RepID=A0AA39VEU7_ACESA|nr:hypothetical protein LWI29_032793 [Acer saccharum]
MEQQQNDSAKMDADPERLKKHMSVCFEIMVHLAEIYDKLRSPENPETIQSLPAGLENPGLEMIDCPSPPPDGEEDSDGTFTSA